jgi:anti-sigma B factor antagonist
VERALPEAPEITRALPIDGADKSTTTRTMIDAHETLVAIAPENLPKFKDVLTYLREDLRQSGGAAERKP